MSESGNGYDAADSSVDNAALAIEALLAPKPEPSEAEKPKEPEAPEPEEQRRGLNPIQAQAAADREEAANPKPEPEAEIQAPVVEEQPKTRDPAQDQRASDVAAKLAEAEAARNQHLQAVTSLHAQLEQAIQGEFSDIKTHQDLLRVAEQDPLRYNRYVIHQGQLQQLQAEKAKVEGEQQAVQAQRFQEWQKGEVEKLPDLIPELKDPAKAPTVVSKIREFAKSKGYSDQQLQLASANDFATLYEAMNFRDMKAAQVAAAKKAANAPPVQKPGAVRDKNSKEDVARTDFQRLRRSGSVDDAANVLKHLFG